MSEFLDNQEGKELFDKINSISLNYRPELFTDVVIENPIFHPRKHTVCSYRSQQRAAKKRRRAK